MCYYLSIVVIISSLFLCNYAVQQNRFHQTYSDAELNHLAKLSNITHFNEVLNNTCIERIVGTSGHKYVYQYIVSTLKDMGWNIKIDKFKDETPIFGTLVFRNIIATLNPGADKYLILACHYDSKYFEEFKFFGASDSAVPCAMLINLAFVMRKELGQKKHQGVALKLIFFDGEEAFETWSPTDSLYGSRHLAAKYEKQRELQKLDLFILLDLLGTPNPTFYRYYENDRKGYSKLVNIEQRLRKLGHLKASQNYFRNKYVDYDIDDDHKPFLARGVPCLHIIPVPFPDNWHTALDNREAIDIATMEDLNKILKVFVAEYLHLILKY